MNYNEVLDAARPQMGPYCKTCPVCNGKACKNTMPGPGSKGSGTVFARNYDKWQEILLNTDVWIEYLCKHIHSARIYPYLLIRSGY